MTETRFPCARHGIRTIGAGLKSLVCADDPPRPASGPKRMVAAWLLAIAATAYLAHGAATYLDLKSGLPFALCAAGGAALAAPMLLVVNRPLLAWRVAVLTAIVTGLAVQAHGRTPFSWHPAVLAAQGVILFVIAMRLPYAVSLWAWASMAVLITISFYPADRIPLIEIVAILMGVACLLRRRRLRATRRPPAADSNLLAITERHRVVA